MRNKVQQVKSQMAPQNIYSQTTRNSQVVDHSFPGNVSSILYDNPLNQHTTVKNQDQTRLKEEEENQDDLNDNGPSLADLISGCRRRFEQQKEHNNFQRNKQLQKQRVMYRKKICKIAKLISGIEADSDMDKNGNMKVIKYMSLEPKSTQNLCKPLYQSIDQQKEINKIKQQQTSALLRVDSARYDLQMIDRKEPFRVQTPNLSVTQLDFGDICFQEKRKAAHFKERIANQFQKISHREKFNQFYKTFYTQQQQELQTLDQNQKSTVPLSNIQIENEQKNRFLIGKLNKDEIHKRKISMLKDGEQSQQMINSMSALFRSMDTKVNGDKLSKVKDITIKKRIAKQILPQSVLPKKKVDLNSKLFSYRDKKQQFTSRNNNLFDNNNQDESFKQESKLDKYLRLTANALLSNRGKTNQTEIQAQAIPQHLQLSTIQSATQQQIQIQNKKFTQSDAALQFQQDQRMQENYQRKVKDLKRRNKWIKKWGQKLQTYNTCFKEAEQLQRTNDDVYVITTKRILKPPEKVFNRAQRKQIDITKRFEHSKGYTQREPEIVIKQQQQMQYEQQQKEQQIASYASQQSQPSTVRSPCLIGKETANMLLNDAQQLTQNNVENADEAEYRSQHSSEKMQQFQLMTLPKDAMKQEQIQNAFRQLVIKKQHQFYDETMTHNFSIDNHHNKLSLQQSQNQLVQKQVKQFYEQVQKYYDEELQRKRLDYNLTENAHVLQERLQDFVDKLDIQSQREKEAKDFEKNFYMELIKQDYQYPNKRH